MIQTFYYPHGNTLQLSHSEDISIPSETDLWAAIGMFFHYVQQQSGEIFLNDQRIVALCMAQTSGSAATPVDYVGLNFPITEVKRLKDIIKWPSAS